MATTNFNIALNGIEVHVSDFLSDNRFITMGRKFLVNSNTYYKVCFMGSGNPEFNFTQSLDAAFNQAKRTVHKFIDNK